jgi:hypothetical protein
MRVDTPQSAFADSSSAAPPSFLSIIKCRITSSLHAHELFSFVVPEHGRSCSILPISERRLRARIVRPPVNDDEIDIVRFDRGRPDCFRTPAHPAEDDQGQRRLPRTRSTRAHKSHAPQRHDRSAPMPTTATARLMPTPVRLELYMNRTAVGLTRGLAMTRGFHGSLFLGFGIRFLAARLLTCQSHAKISGGSQHDSTGKRQQVLRRFNRHR